MRPADNFQADYLINEVDPADYDGLVLPGGAVNADNLRMGAGGPRVGADAHEGS